jgi:hypothetical protein
MAEKLHNNYQIRWKNYKRFEDTDWITLRPITLLIGPNSSGKTSVLSPLLLLSQTISSPDGDTAVVTRGPMVDIGNYRDFVHDHDCDRGVFFGIRHHTHDAPKGVKALGTYPPGALEITLGPGEEPQDTTLQRYELFDLFKRSFIARDRRPDGTYTLSGAVSPEKMSAAEKVAMARSSPVNFLFSPTSAIGAFKRSTDDGPTESERFTADFSEYLRIVGFSFTELRSLFSSLSYVGPLRQKPQKYYRVSSEAPRTVGPQGQYAANLFRRREKKIGKKVNQWIKRFEFGDALTAKKVNDDLFELCFSVGKSHYNFVEAGFGASQVLPLIIQAFAAPKDSLTLAEQPEIHLNPKLQCVLADLFVEMANSQHRIVVETHSEHLLLRLRALVAAKKIRAKDVAIYFVERDGKASKVREVPLGEDGGLQSDAWPAGFFDDALRESLALAAAQHRSAR